MMSQQEISDRLEITDLITRYVHAADRQDFDLLESCYHPDATDNHGRFSGPFSAVFEELKKLGGTLAETFHQISPPLIVLDGDRAQVETYLLYRRQIVGGDETTVVLQGQRYVDVVTRRDGAWRIAERTVVLDWEHAAPPPPAVPSVSSWSRGAYGPADPAWSMIPGR